MHIEVSQDFRKKTKAAVSSIVIFVFVYLLIFLFTIALAAACIGLGIWLIAVKPMFITLMLGIGLAGTGVFIFFFIIKFLFKKHLNDRSYLTEIRRSDEPELFKMIDDIVEEAETDFPKKVYLSYDVNASVFYDSSFWSMFFPIQKNLTIGVGLINTSTKQEIKAVLSHEFGHFSQRSMKVGSYVYNVNQIIFNLVNDDASYRNSIEKFASFSGYFSIFAMLAFFFTSKIQWILAKMYSYVNIRHMALSREMEFHADEVAANIAGSLSLEESLLRMELANNSYHCVLDFYDARISKNQSSKNIYREQFFVMNFLAQQSELETKYGLPHVKISESGLFNKSKLVIENQWASHPSTEDRIAKLRHLNIVKDNDGQSAKNLFKDFEKTEEKLTSKLFSNVKYKRGRTDVQFETFKSEFETQYRKDSFDKIFNNYYDNKNPGPEVQEHPLSAEIQFENLFNKEKTELVYTLIASESDKKTIEAIVRKEFVLKTFDYDGKKYKAAEAKKLIPEIEKSISEIKDQISRNDADIYSYFLRIAENHGKKSNFITVYQFFSDYDRQYEEKYKLYTDLIESTAFISTQTPFEQITKNFAALKPLEEKLKQELTLHLQNPLLTAELSGEEVKDFDYYIREEHIYFSNQEYFDIHLQMLMKAINSLPYFLNRKYFLKKKEVLSLMKDLEDSHRMEKVS